MAFYDRVETRSLVLVDENRDPVVELALSRNNENPQRPARLHIGFAKDYPAEIEIEPGADSHPVGNIASQIMLWGARTADGAHRQRLTLSIVVDGGGGAAAILDSTTNDPSNSAGQSRAMPLVINAGEGKGLYVVLHPSDNTIGIQDRSAGVEWRGKLAELISTLGNG